MNIKNINDKFSFTIVRNPWSRLISTYSFLTKGSEVHVPPEANVTKHNNFKTLYDDEAIDLVTNLYEKDITYFNFRFDD